MFIYRRPSQTARSIRIPARFASTQCPYHESSRRLNRGAVLLSPYAKAEDDDDLQAQFELAFRGFNSLHRPMVLRKTWGGLTHLQPPRAKKQDAKKCEGSSATFRNVEIIVLWS